MMRIFVFALALFRWNLMEALGAANGSTAASAWTDLLEMISTPFGPRHPLCVYEWPNGTQIEPERAILPNGTVVNVPPCPHVQPLQGSYKGWVASAWAHPPSGDSEFTYFSSNFNVPSEPVGTDETQDMTYIFNGLENSGGSFILQPVLQYSNYWTGKNCFPDTKGQWNYRSFAVDNKGNAHCGDPYPVSVGDTVTGIMKQLSPGTWQIWAGKDNEGYSYTMSGVEPQTSAQFALELWYPDQCEAYPRSPIEFTGALLQTSSGTITPDWVTDYDPKAVSCGQHVTVNGPNDVVISETSRTHQFIV